MCSIHEDFGGEYSFLTKFSSFETIFSKIKFYPVEDICWTNAGDRETLKTKAKSSRGEATNWTGLSEGSDHTDANWIFNCFSENPLKNEKCLCEGDKWE